MAELFLSAHDERLSWWAPQAIDRVQSDVRLQRFPAAVAEVLAGQIGPLANLRSSSGCALMLRTDSPWITVHVARLRHHQVAAQSMAMEVVAADGARWEVDSGDLRERDGDVTLRLPTGLERGREPGSVSLWMPPISTAAIAGISCADGALVEPQPLPAPRLLCLGDSLVQGFTCQSPLHTWPHRVGRALGLPTWNLGVGGIRIDIEAFSWALNAHPWQVVIIGLGSNMAWLRSDLDAIERVATDFAQQVCASAARRVLWCLPPWKPCEAGKGPSEFMGLALDAEAGRRFGECRQRLRACLLPFAPRLELLDDLLPHDHRAYPDGLHPFAPGFARMAQAISQQVLKPAL